MGFGPLAKTEQKANEHAAVEREKLSDYTGSTRESNIESSAHTSNAVVAVAEHNSRPAVSEETPRPSSSVVAPSSGPSPKTTDWIGLWRGTDTTRYQIPNFPSQPMDDANARIRIESSQGQRIKFILIDSSNDKDLCTLTATLDRDQAKLDPGQPCFGTDEDDGNLSVQVKSGLALLRETTLILDITLDADVQSEQFQARGSVEYHFEGKKM